MKYRDYRDLPEEFLQQVRRVLMWPGKKRRGIDEKETK